MIQIISWIWVFSGILLILLVLLHSPKGDGMGGLADIAPTLLQLLNLPIPREMTGKSLIQEIELKGYNKVVQHV